WLARRRTLGDTKIVLVLGSRIGFLRCHASEPLESAYGTLVCRPPAAVTGLFGQAVGKIRGACAGTRSSREVLARTRRRGQTRVHIADASLALRAGYC